MAKPCTRLDVSQQGRGEIYFFLPVFFFAFAFFAFLAMLPSVIPQDRFNASRASTCINARVYHNWKIDTACFEEVNAVHVACDIRVEDAQ
jgi:hypothetical protein